MRKEEASSTRDYETGSQQVGNGDLQPSECRSIARLLLADETGQVLPWVVVMMIAVLMVCALVVDVGHAMVVQRQLQASADAAALAAAQAISGTSTTYQTTGADYSAGSGDENAYTGVTVGTPTVTPLCLTTVSGWGIPCTSSGGSVTIPNAVSVTETASVPTLFAGIFGKPSVTVSATSTAAHARPQAYNIALIVDSTLSMAATDSNCGSITAEQCALNGIQQLLKGISTTYDYVSLFTFPSVQTGSPAGVAPTASSTYTCTSSPVPSSYQGVSYYNTGSQGMGYTPLLLSPLGNGQKYEPPWSGIAWAMPYNFPPIPTGTSGYTPPSGTEGPTYEVVPFKNDYNTNSGGSTTLNSSSTLVKAVGAVSGCGGIAPSSYDGNYGTYYAGALYAAQAALLAEQASRSGSSNVMIILGDGDSDAPQSSDGVYLIPSSSSQATETYLNSTSLTTTAYTYPSSYKIATSGGTYPSWVDECQQSVTAAQYAATYSSNKTQVYTIAYGALTSGCPTDTTLKNPCQALQEMATQVSGETVSDYFYSDWAATGGSAGCKANTANSGVTAINDIYTAITAALTNARLIPNGTT
jgi:Flp pilus assembly protein TadG